MAQFILRENSDGTVSLNKKTQVLAEVCGKVNYINNTNKTLFSIHAEKMDRKFRCKLSYSNPFCPLREGDAFFGIAEYFVDPQYGETLNIIQPPFVVPGEDKTTIINNFVNALRGTGFGTMKAHSLLNELELKTGSLTNSINTLDRLSSHFFYKNESDPALLQPYSHILKEKQMMQLLQWWYKNRNLRRLYLFGLTNTEIRNSKISPEDLYKLCLENPYKIFPLDLNKCDNIYQRIGKDIDPNTRYCAEIARKLNEFMEQKGWTGVPSGILLQIFPDTATHINTLRNVFDIKTDLHTVYLPYAYEVETGICDLVKNLIDGPVLPNSVQKHEIIYTRNDLTAEQKSAIEHALNDNICVIRGLAGSGKCLHPHTPILMHDGQIKKMMNIKIGESVMGPDSKSRLVLSRCNGLGQMYKIIPSKGREFICNDKHMLTMIGIVPYIIYNKNKASPYIVCRSVKGILTRKLFKTNEDAEKFIRTLDQDIFELTVEEYLNRKRSEEQRYCYLFHTGIDFPEQEVPFDPYIIGMWLGDGTTADPVITNADKEIIDKVESIINIYGLTLHYGGKYKYTIVGKGENYWVRGANKFINTLRQLNLFDNKHIPDIYKINSRRVRLEVLAGLIDSDGYNAGNYYEIIQKNKRLADDIEYLAFSLGFMVSRKECKKGCMYKGEMRTGIYQRISIFGKGLEEIPAILERKQCYPRKAKNRAHCLRFKIEPIGLSLYHGFELSGDGRFLLGDFLVTHNSSLIKELIHNLKNRGIKYRVMSFTGKAVARIREITEQKEPMTMHMSITLGAKKNEFSHIIIDEASMVTSELLYEFCKKFGSEYRITLVGDPNQLPPIGWGMMFEQIIKSDLVPICNLRTCHRTGNNGILINANNIVECNKPGYNGPPFQFEETNDFTVVDGDISTVHELLKILQDSGIQSSKITVISPYNKYLSEINQVCQKIYNENNRSTKDEKHTIWKINDRVMMTENNYKINIMNGDEGLITDITSTQIQVTFKDGSSHIFLLSTPGDTEENRGIEKTLTTQSLVHSFAVSVHRYQGSECDYVIFFIPQSPESKFLNRNLLYTGITRAKKFLWMIGDVDTMTRAATTAPAYRCDNLARRLIASRTIEMEK